MPPKPKYTKQQIIDAAFELTRERGINCLVARELGKKLGTSATPIFTFFSGMDELKTEVRAMARWQLMKYMDGVFDYSPAFKEFGLRWIRFANQEPHLYELILRDDNGNMKDFDDIVVEYKDLVIGMTEQVSQTFNIGIEDARSLFRNMMIYANGIAGFSDVASTFKDEEHLNRLIGKVCISLAIGYQIKSGSFNKDVADIMLGEESLNAKPILRGVGEESLNAKPVLRDVTEEK